MEKLTIQRLSKAFCLAKMYQLENIQMKQEYIKGSDLYKYMLDIDGDIYVTLKTGKNHEDIYEVDIFLGGLYEGIEAFKIKSSEPFSEDMEITWAYTGFWCEKVEKVVNKIYQKYQTKDEDKRKKLEKEKMEKEKQEKEKENMEKEKKNKKAYFSQKYESVLKDKKYKDEIILENILYLLHNAAKYKIAVIDEKKQNITFNEFTMFLKEKKLVISDEKYVEIINFEYDGKLDFVTFSDNVLGSVFIQKIKTIPELIQEEVVKQQEEAKNYFTRKYRLKSI